MSSHTRAPSLVLSKNARCPCGSGQAYRRCCHKLTRSRRLLLQRFIARHCRLSPRDSLAVSALRERFTGELARRGQQLPVACWLGEDLASLGHAVSRGQRVGGLRWRTEVSGPPHPAGQDPAGVDPMATGRSVVLLLDDALAALDRGRPQAALDALLAVWRRTRMAELVAPIRAISERTASARGPLAFGGPRVSRGERERRWLAAAAKRDSGLLSALLAEPWPGRLAEVLRRMVALARLGPDPRLVPAFGELALSGGFTSEQSLVLWREVARQWAASDDGLPREGSTVRALSNSALTAVIRRHGSEADLQVLEQLGRGPRLPRHALPAATRRRLVALQRACSPAAHRGDHGEAALVARVVACPRDDVARQVYGDWLLDRGDLRGELINLQCALAGDRGSPDRERRVAELIAQHGRRWLGALAAVTRPDQARFERGFVTACVCYGSARELRSVIGDASWATVRELCLPGYMPMAELTELLAAESTRYLRVVRGVPMEVARQLSRRPGALERVEELALEGGWAYRARGLRWRAFGHLRHLGVDRWARPAQLELSQALGKLEQLTVYCRQPSELAGFVEWLSAMRTEPSALRRLSFVCADAHYRPRGVRLQIERGVDGELSALRVTLGPEQRPTKLGLVNVIGGLEALAADAPTSLVIDPRCPRPSRYHQGRLDALVVRFSQARVVFGWRATSPAAEECPASCARNSR